MAIDEKLIGLAFSFRDARLWEKLFDSDIYAVDLGSGQTAYCCVMGNAGEHYGLGVYVGGRGWNSYLSMYRMKDFDSEVEMRESFCRDIDCINCDYTPAKYVSSSPQKKKGYGLCKGTQNPNPTQYWNSRFHSL